MHKVYDCCEVEADMGCEKNIALVKEDLGQIIYDQAVLEGCEVSFGNVKEILEQGESVGVNEIDLRKVLNLKEAWEFVLDPDVLDYPSEYSLLCHIAGLVNQDLVVEGGRMRSTPVMIGGSSYVPPVPSEPAVKEKIREITGKDSNAIDTAIELCMYCMKTQVFRDGNKRASVIFANHYLISHNGGYIVIPEEKVNDFRRRLVGYYEGDDLSVVSDFIKKYCWKVNETA